MEDAELEMRPLEGITEVQLTLYPIHNKFSLDLSTRFRETRADTQPSLLYTFEGYKCLCFFFI